MSGVIDQVLERVGLTYDDLSKAEKDTLYTWLDQLQKNQMTLEHVRTHVGNLKESVERELVEEPEFNYLFIFKVPNRKQVFLKARLRNLMLMEAFLSSPDRARKAIENAIAARFGGQ